MITIIIIMIMRIQARCTHHGMPAMMIHNTIILARYCSVVSVDGQHG